MPIITKLTRQINGSEYPFSKRDFPTTLISAISECGCKQGEHSYTTIAVTHNLSLLAAMARSVSSTPNVCVTSSSNG